MNYEIEEDIVSAVENDLWDMYETLPENGELQLITEENFED